MQSISLFSIGGFALLLALLESHLGDKYGMHPAAEIQLLHRRLYTSYFLLSGLGYVVQGIASTVPQSNGSALLMLSRLLAIASAAPLIVLVNGVGEAVWPSRRWRSVYFCWTILLFILSASIFILVAMAEELLVVTVSLSLAALHFYAAAIWTAGACAFAHYKLNCAAALVFSACQVSFAALDPACGAYAHADCYRNCPTLPGRHYLFALSPTFFSYCLMAMSHTDAPSELAWPEAFFFRQAGTTQQF